MSDPMPLVAPSRPDPRALRALGHVLADLVATRSDEPSGALATFLSRLERSLRSSSSLIVNAGPSPSVLARAGDPRQRRLLSAALAHHLILLLKLRLLDDGVFEPNAIPFDVVSSVSGILAIARSDAGETGLADPARLAELASELLSEIPEIS